MGLVDLKKTLPNRERETKKVADAADPPIVVPVVLIAEASHLALVIPAVKGDIANMPNAAHATAL